MKKLDRYTIKVANGIIAAILVLVPFHAFLTVWGGSLLGHYALLRLWSSGLLLVLTIIVVVWLVTEANTRNYIFRSALMRLILIYAALSVGAAVAGLLTNNISIEAVGLGLIYNLRFFVFFVAVSLVAKKSKWLSNNWSRLVLWPATIVIGFTMLQFFVLPADFLKHFGYKASTIPASFTVNSDSGFHRVASTLRGPNPLGAYMLVILSISLTLLFIRQSRAVARNYLVAFGSLVTLLLSFSRSAWLGTGAAMGVVVVWLARTRRARRIVILTCLGLIVCAVVAYASVGDETGVQNALFHTSNKSKVEVSSNEARLMHQREGLRQAIESPAGRGVGVAGPASYQNKKAPSVITENYFTQIAIEVGWIGLALLVSIFLLVGRELWVRRSDSLALGLLASFIGLVVVNVLSHAWTDDTLAYVWWGLAGLAIGSRHYTNRWTS